MRLRRVRLAPWCLVLGSLLLLGAALAPTRALGGQAPATPVSGNDCAADAAQSPIAFDPNAAEPGSLTGPELRYSPTGLTLWNDGGKKLQADLSAGDPNHLILDGVRFDLTELHFHWPVEHVISGVTAEMELHLVHADSSGRLAVVAVLIAAGGDGSGALDRLFSMIPAGSGWRRLVPTPFHPGALIPPGTGPLYRYPGSLTSPPFGECVQWTLMPRPLQVSASAIAAYKARFPQSNARLPQPANGRVPLRVMK